MTLHYVPVHATCPEKWEGGWPELQDVMAPFLISFSVLRSVPSVVKEYMTSVCANRGYVRAV